MSCREFVTLFLPDWLATTLPRRRARECAEHLARCRDCAEYARSYRLVVAQLQRVRAAPQVTMPEDLVQAILRQAG